MLIIFMLYKEIKYYYYIKWINQKKDEVAAVKYYLKASEYHLQIELDV